MTQDFSIAGVISQTKRDGSRYEPVGKLAGLGGLLGILAGLYGLLYSNTENMFQLIGETPSSGIMMLLLGVGLLLQSIGGRELRIKLGSSFSQVSLLGAFIGLAYFPFLIMTSGWTLSQYNTFVSLSAMLTAFFIIMWQMYSVIFTDSTDRWIGVFASIMNGFFFPVLAVGTILGELFVMLAYVILILGQVTVLFYWWGPLDSIREYARSPDKAKFSFGLSGVLAFMIGSVAVFANATTGTDAIWYPFSAPFEWNYTLAAGFIAALLFWVMQGPRLGKKELKAAEISDDLIHGGSKYFPAFLTAVGIFAALQAATFLPEAIESWALIIVWAASGTMFLVGAIYMGRTDVVTGFPLVLSAIMMSIHPSAIAIFVIGPYILVLISQVFLMVETKVRGFTYYSQPFLSVLATIGFSLVFLAFMLGLFGSGPAAIWPTNRWFNVTLFAPLYDTDTQAATVLVLPIAALMIRNVAVVGFGQKQTGEAKDVISGITMLFAFLIPIIAAAFKGVTHQALTAAAIMLALYMITFVLVLSLNLSLAGEVEDTGNPLEGMLLRMTAIVSLVFGTIIAMVVLGTFSSTAVTALETANVITWLVILIGGLEVLLTLGWIIAGARLGMFKSGFSFRRGAQALAEVEYVPVQ